MKGIITSIFDWFTHPLNSKENEMDWLAFLVLAFIFSFLWSMVVNQIEA